MRRSLLGLSLILLFASQVLAAGAGQLVVFSDIPGVDIYVDGLYHFKDKQSLFGRLGYVSYNGRIAYPSDISNAGIFMKAGIAYEL